MKLVDVLANWHPIVQGALGSGFFWLVLEVGQRLGRNVTERLEKGREPEELPVAGGDRPPDFRKSGHSRYVSVYSGTHYIAKGLIVLTISLGLKELIPIVSLVGFLVSIYFFFRAISYVPRRKVHGKKPKNQAGKS